jgi:hypothetical protein
LPVFKTGAFNRSAIPPAHGVAYYQLFRIRQEAVGNHGLNANETDLGEEQKIVAKTS